MSQLGLFVPAPPPPGLPPGARDILHAARSINGLSRHAHAPPTRIVRGHWGAGYQERGRKWILTDTCCCPLAAWLVVKGAKAEDGDKSAVPSVARLMGIEESDVYAFIAGFDGKPKDSDSTWFEYGQTVAKELGL